MKKNVNALSGWLTALIFACWAFWGTANSMGVTYTQVFNTPGTTNYWQCPQGVTNVQVECWGGGGAGGSGRTTGNSATGTADGGGGGGGAYAELTNLLVTPGNSYAIVIPPVATASAPGFSQDSGAPSGSSVTFSNEFGMGLIAYGGGGGENQAQNSTSTLTGTGGSGGGVTTGVSASFTGGNGAKAATTASGGSGAGASNTRNGNSASTSTTTAGVSGGATTSGSDANHNGGAGTNGVSNVSGAGKNGLPGATPGGGGSGGAVQGIANASFAGYGGNGGAGQIILTYSFKPSTIVKANNPTNLNNGNSYVGGAAPDPYTSVTFNNTLQNYGTFSLGGNFTWGGIVVSNPASAIVIANDGSTLTNGNSGIDMSQATVNLTLDNPVALAASQTWNVTNTRTLLVAGQVSGTGTITAAGGGTIQLGAANVLPGTVSLALNAGTLDLNTFSQTIGTLTGSGVIDTVAGGTPSLTLSNGVFSGNLQNTAGSLSLVMSGPGTQTLSGGNTYSGATTINGGDLLLNNLNAISNSAAISVASGASLQLNAAGTYPFTGTLSLVGPGLTGTTDPGALFFGSGGATASTLNAPLNLGGATTISSYGVTMNQTLNGVIGGAGPLTFDSRGGANTHTAVWLLNATNAYTDNTTIFNDNGLLDVTVMLGATNALPITTSVNLRGVTTMTGSIYATLDLNGFPQTLAGLTDTNSSSSNASGTFGTRVINSSTNPATLTIDIASGTETFGTAGTRVIPGTLGGTTAGLVAANNLSLVKIDSGTLVLGGTNTYTGNTTVSGGTLQIDGSGVSPVEVQSGANLTGGGNVGAAVTVDEEGSVTAGDVSGNVLTAPSLTFNGSGSLTVANPLVGYTNVAAVNVTGALTLGGIAGGVTLNLPIAPVANGVYHLVQFGSGISDASGFALGTVPTPTAGQSAVLQVDTNYLDYVVTSGPVTNPPVLVSTIPVNNALGVSPTAQLIANFSENVTAGSGNIELHKSSDGTLVASYNVSSSSQIAFSGTQLILQPTSGQLTNLQYYVVIPAGAVQDLSGNQFAGLTSPSNWTFAVTVPPVLYTDTGSPTNPPWLQVSNTVASAGYIGGNYPGPIYGSIINVNNPAVEVGLYGNRPISVGSMKIQVACNTSSANFGGFTRWYQNDGNTQVLRVFVNDENVATARSGVSLHNEAYITASWNYTNNVTYEWTGHYTIAKSLQGCACFQDKNSDNDWAFQLGMTSEGTLSVNERYGPDIVVTNADGSARNFNGSGFDVRVLDDGLNYKVWIDGVLYASSSFSRPTGQTNFRWGMYFGADNLHPPADYNLILVSGAQVQSWPGKLATSTSTITKANNTTSLDNGGSWAGGTAPGLYNQAVWNNTVTAANTTTLANAQEWAGIQILNPGGLVTINGTKTLVLNGSGVDLTAATQNLTVNCPVQMATAGNWGVASGRTATFNGAVSGYPGLTLSGGGTLNLGSSNSYSGNTTVSAGELQLGANWAIPGGAGNGNVSLAGTLDLNGFSDLINGLSGSGVIDCTAAGTPTLTVGANDQTSIFTGVITNTAGTLSLAKTGVGTQTLSGTNAYKGATTVSGGMLQMGVSGVASSVTLANPGFETPAMTGWAYSPSGASWTFSSAGIDANSGTWYASTTGHQGTQAGFIQGSGSISQLFTAASAGIYAITFQAEGRAGTHGPDGIIVQVDGVPVATWGASAINQTNWLNYQATARLTAGNHTLAFVGNNTLGGDRSVAIDNVQMFQPLGIGLLPPVTDVNLSGGLGATLDLGGAAQTVGSLAGATGSSVLNNTSLTAGGDGLSTSFAGVISGAGLVTKTGTGTLTLSGANSYSGGTTVSNGTLLVTGSTGSGAVTVTSGSTLGGTGTLAGNVTNSGTLLPGASGAGTLTISGNLTLSAGSTNTFAVNGSTLAQTAVSLGGTAAYGGVLNIVPTGTFTAGQTFTLFSGPGTTNASRFASIAGSPGTGLSFTFANGVLSVVSGSGGPSGPAQLTNSLSGSTLSLSWPSGQGWRLQAQTNSLSVGLTTNWVYITDGTTSMTNLTVSPSSPAVFYRLTYP